MQPAADEIRAQLERMLASPVFANSGRLSRFLRHVVECSLAGEAGRLKEHVIGLEVYDRDASYDPRLDAIVRVEAGRLRGKIEEYYRTAGATDGVRIRLGKGGYAPAFELLRPATADAVVTPLAPPTRRRGRWPVVIALPALLAVLAIGAIWNFRHDRMRQAAADANAIAVLPFFSYGKDDQAQALGLRLSEGVAAALVRDARFAVIPSSQTRRYQDPDAVPDNLASTLGARLLLQGRVELRDGQVEVEALLVDAGRNRKFWVDTVRGETGEVEELETRIARRAADAAVAAFAGETGAGQGR